MGAHQAAVALFHTKLEGIGVVPLKQPHLFTDELEAGEHIDIFHTEGFGHRADHVGGDDGADHRAVGGQDAQLLPAAQEVVTDQDAGHVAGEGLVFAGGPVQGKDAQPVGVGVRGKDQVCALLFGIAQSQGEGGPVLGVGAFSLWGSSVGPPVPAPQRHSGSPAPPGPGEPAGCPCRAGGVHDFQAGGFGDGVVIQNQGLDGGHILVVDLLAHGVIQTGGHGSS